MEKITAAIIGLGRIASLLEDDTLREKPCTHAGAIAANQDCKLDAGSDINEERRRFFSEKWSVPVYAEPVEMLRVHKPQILVIATNPDSHYHYCRLAASFKPQVIICEKPLSDNIKDARKIAHLANDEIKIITNHERRYSQDYIRVKEILDKEILGKVLSVRAVIYMGETTRLLDVLWHDGTHLADAIMFLTDSELKHKRRWGAKLTSNQKDVSNKKEAVRCTAWLQGELYRKKSKQLTHVQTAHLPVLVITEIGNGRDHLVFEIEFSCEKGRLRIGNGIFEIWESSPSPYAEKFRSLKQTSETFTGATGYFSNMIKDAVCCIKEPGRQPSSGALDGLRVIEYLNDVKAWR